MKIHGVNLGNWLVLEKWMNPALFFGTTAEDEYYLPRQLSKEVYESRIRIHRSEYITERDFAYIRSLGLNAVRLPIPYSIFGDRPPFIGCLEEVDKAFGWAERYGLQILLDLHTVPMGQNGFDNGGISGVCKWSQMPDEVEFVIQVLEKLADRYGRRKGLLGIEALNEPITQRAWEVMNVPVRYPAAEPELAKGSGPISLSFLRNFYQEVYTRIRPRLSEDKLIVFHDGFELKAWKEFFTEGDFRKVALDTHQYLMTAEAKGCAQNPSAYLEYIQEHYEKDIIEVQSYVPVICGEWCMFNSYLTGHDTKGGQSVLNGMDYSQQEVVFSDREKKEVYQAITTAQLAAWNRGIGHFYWSYKLLLDTVNDKNWIGWDSWDLGKATSMGWFPPVSE